MAFDSDTRNQLRSTVEQCRKLLCGTYDKLGGEITAQLQEYFGIQPTGEIADVDDLALDEAGREKARVLRDLIGHYAASDSGGGSEKAVRARAVQRLVLEQAFTVVNRLAALRMAEERDILPACISSGMDSDGFQLYEQTAGTDMGERFDRYRSYLFCLFDELTLDLAPLFDRYSPQGLIFPRERALLDLLDLLNGDGVKHLWGEDETIGWVYQYWNSKEERKAMRDASAAPRNSRELAVRNQFFTPRYVVQFLTDNTLGRIWYEMCRGETRLVEECEYLVRRPHEIFMLDADEYVDDKCGEWVKEVREGNFAAAEFEASWEEITAIALALAIEGDSVAEQMGYGDVHDYVRERGNRAIEEGVVEDATLLDQWLLLFSIQRGMIREGDVFDNEAYARAAKSAWEAWVIAAKAEACDPVSPTELANLTSPPERLADTREFLFGEDAESTCPDWVERAWAGDLSQLDSAAMKDGRLVALALSDSCYPIILDDEDFDPRKNKRLQEVVEAIREDLSNPDTENLRVVWAALSSFVGNEDPKKRDDETWSVLWAHFCRLARINTAALKIQELGQEELLNKPVFVPPRPFKDPREIRLLDPACGSMHFGLYAFDLYETIYEEAWQRGLVPEGEFESFEDFQSQVPRLIIEHNIHGVDIDPRAAQIAGLSLWLRAQRSWKRQGVRPGDRPVVERSNIVCAEPMPGDEAQLAAFTKELHPVLAHMVRAIFEKMQLAGEAGSLLKIEEEITGIVREAREAWEKIGKSEGEMFSAAELAAGDQRAGGQQELALGEFTLEDLASVPAVAFFDQAEDEIYELLERYAEGAGEGSYQRRLFAEDAARGFAFIDLCRKRYDAVVMNPPFGESSNLSTDYLGREYSDLCGNILCGFIERTQGLLADSGAVSCIVDKTITIKSSYSKIRERLLQTATPLGLMADLGWGVLDAAQVETVCLVMTRRISRSISFFSRQECSDSNISPSDCDDLEVSHSVTHPVSFFINVPNMAISYDLPGDLLHLFAGSGRYEPDLGDARQGLGVSDSWRWYRAYSEIPVALNIDQDAYARLTNGGGFSPYFRDSDLAIFWEDDGRAIKAREGQIYGSWSRTVKNVKYYFRAGVSFPKRTEHLNAHALPEGFIFTVEGLGFFPAFEQDSLEQGWMSLCLLNSRLPAFLINRFCGQHKHVGYIKKLPIPGNPVSRQAIVACEQSFILKQAISSRLGNTALFSVPALFDIDRLNSLVDLQTDKSNASSLAGAILSLENIFQRANELLQSFQQIVDGGVFEAFQLSAEAQELVKAETRTRPGCTVTQGVVESESIDSRVWVYELNEYFVGCGFGRWDIRNSTGERQPPELPEPFGPLPACPPGMLQNDSGLPAEPADVPDGYPLRISWPGILVDDERHDEDIVARVREALAVIWKDRAEAIEQEACEILGVRTFRAYFAENKSGGKFFKEHLSRYSKSRRQAPIYWPLSTESGSYTLWLYYHRFTDQTLFACVSDFVEPKIAEVSARFAALSDKADDRSAKEQKEWEQLETFLGELNAFRDELLRVAHLPWKPNLNDGVLITAAPLWKLFRLTAWRNKLKKCWESLEKGEYNWAHLAYTLWPAKVLESCRTDRSIAIAHDVEDLFWEEDENGKWQPREPDEEEVEKAMKEGRLLANPLEKETE